MKQKILIPDFNIKVFKSLTMHHKLESLEWSSGMRPGNEVRVWDLCLLPRVWMTWTRRSPTTERSSSMTVPMWRPLPASAHITSTMTNLKLHSGSTGTCVEWGHGCPGCILLTSCSLSFPPFPHSSLPPSPFTLSLPPPSLLPFSFLPSQTSAPDGGIQCRALH